MAASTTVDSVSPGDDDILSLKRAGRDALIFNAPLSSERADDLINEVISGRPRAVVDLGCGRGAMLRLLAARSPSVRAVGVDTDPEVLRQAAELAEASSVADRVHFELADAAEWMGDVDAVVCVGASHAFGGPGKMMERVASLSPGGVALIGDGVWESTPDQWCLEVFGELPVGVEGLANQAIAAGWTVDDADLSTLVEWDDFEHGWIKGVRAVGTSAAEAFADERQAEYLKYRGVLGFGWVRLRR